MARTKILIAILFITVLTLTVSWIRFEFLTPDEPISVSTLSPEPTTQDFLDRLTQAFSLAPDYTALITTQDEDGTQNTITIQYQQPDITHAVFSSPDGTGENQVISTPNAVFMKSPKLDQWLQLPKDTQTDLSDVEFDLNSFRESTSTSSAQPQYQGVKPCDNLSCHSFISYLGDTTTTILFDTNQYLLRQVFITGPQSSTILYNYSPVEISLPIAKDVIVMPEDPDDADPAILQAIMEP